ncbi:MAG TPA: hypothetical protein ENI61_00590 [Ignavibacteria bacterium]|nr:hypothetical protein [Ignavibacteria bacterium]
MRNNKRGISSIVVSLMMIVLVLVAVSVIWYSVKTILKGGTEQINQGTKCLKIDVTTTNLICNGTNNDTCSVTVTRNPGGEDIAGIKLVFTNSTGTKNYVYDVPGNIAPLEAKTESGINTNVSNANNVKVVIYFKDAAGKEQLCSTTI